MGVWRWEQIPVTNKNRVFTNSKNPNKIQLSDTFKEVLYKIFSKKLQNTWPGNNLNYVQNLMKYAMAPGAEVISSLYVDQRSLFQILLQNIDKIKGAIL